MLWVDFNRKLTLPEIEPLTATRLSQGKDSKHRNHPRLREVFASTADVEDVLLANHQPNSDGDVKILLDIPYSEDTHREHLQGTSQPVVLQNRYHRAKCLGGKRTSTTQTLIFWSGNSSRTSWGLRTYWLNKCCWQSRKTCILDQD